jgi:hypothetical protein
MMPHWVQWATERREKPLIQRAASDGIEARTADAAPAAVLSVQIVKAQAAQAIA